MMPRFIAAQRGVFLLACLVWLGGSSFSVQAQYRLDAWTTENGLHSNAIWSILQTRDGYLWVSTSQGLVRFDGVRLTVFDKISSPGITGNRFSVLYEDRAGNLWAGTEDGGLIRYRDGVFTSWTLKDGLPSLHVDRIDEDATGTIWIYTDQGIARWRAGQMTKVTETAGTNLQNLIWSKEAFYQLFRSGAWQRRPDGWQRFIRGAWEELPFPPQLQGQPPQLLRYLFEDTRGRLWYGLLNSEREQFCVEAGQVQTYHLPAELSLAFYHDRQGRLWASDKTDGVYVWKAGQTVRLPLPGPRPTPVTEAVPSVQTRSPKAAPQGLSWNRLVYEDRENNIWLGTYDQGLLKLMEQVIFFVQLPGSPRERYVYPLLEDRAGNVWVSGGEAGLLRYSNGQFTHFPLPGVTGPTDLSALYEDRDGSLWVGTFRHGIARLSQGVLQIERALSDKIKERVDVIHRDRAGHLWFGGRNGLHRLDESGQLTRFSVSEGLASAHVKTLLEDSAGRLWVGGYGGVSLWQAGRFKTWTQAEGLLSDRVIILYEDQEQNIWAGTYDGGLYRLREKATGWQLTRYTTREGLFTNEVKQILEDEQGFLWIGSGLGLYRLRKQELNDFAEGRVTAVVSTHFGRADGLLNTDIGGGFQPSGFKARDGRLWFATQDGIAVLDPRRVPFNPVSPPVVIEACLLDRQPAAFQQGLEITPGQESLEISYTGLSLIKSEQIRFRYRMEGLEANWNEAGTRRTAYYTRIPAGRYTFRVLAANSDGVWNTTGQSLSITVWPPFYRTWWFVTLISCAVAGLLAAAFKYRVQQLKQQQAVQQVFAQQLITSQEAERKRIAGELHDSLGQSLILIRNWALLGSSQLEPVAPAREELDEINTTASRAINEVRAIAYNLGPYHLDRLGLAETLRDMIQRVAQASGIVFTTELDALNGRLSREAEMNLYRIAQEALNNLVKHSGATAATIALQQLPASVKLTITDNGQGFDPAATRTAAPSGGFGLYSLAERVRLLRGSWTLHSAPGAGTRIEVLLPLEEKSA